MVLCNGYKVRCISGRVYYIYEYLIFSTKSIYMSMDNSSIGIWWNEAFSTEEEDLHGDGHSIT